MTDIARLGIQVDSSGVKKSRIELDRFTRQGERTERGIKTATGRMRNEFRSLEKSVFSLHGAIAALGGGLIAREMMRTIELQGRLARENELLAQAFGTTSATMQAFGYAAQRTGLDVEKATDIVKDLQDKLGDAALTGGGEAADPLKRLGLSARELIALDPTAQLEAIGGALEGLPRAQQVFVLESFADDASRLLPLLDDGAAGLKALTNEARELGVVMSDETASKLIEADGAMRKLKQQGDIMQRQFAVALTPTVRTFADVLASDLKDGLDDSQRDVVNWGGTFADIMTFSADAASASIGVTSALFESLGTTAAASAAQISAAIRGDWQQAMTIGDLWAEDQAKIWDDLANNSDFSKYRDRLREIRDGANSMLPTIGVNARDPGGRIIDVGNAGKASQGAYSAREAGMAQFQDSIQAEAEQWRELDRLRREFADPEQLAYMDFEKRSRAIDQYAMNEAQKTELMAQNWAKLTDDINGETDRMSVFATRAGENIQDQLGRTVSQTLRGEFGGIADSWSNMILDMVAQAQAAQLARALMGDSFADDGKFGGLIGAGISTIGGMLGGGVSSASAGQSLADAGIGGSSFGIQSMFGGGLATGGPASAGMLYEVNERGPELFSQGGRDYLMMGGESGHVTPSTPAVSGGSQQQAPQMHVNIAPPSGYEAQTEEKQRPDGGIDMNVVFKQVKNGLIEDVRLRGSFSRAMRAEFPQLQHSGR